MILPEVTGFTTALEAPIFYFRDFLRFLQMFTFPNITFQQKKLMLQYKCFYINKKLIWHMASDNVRCITYASRRNNDALCHDPSLHPNHMNCLIAPD